MPNRGPVLESRSEHVLVSSSLTVSSSIVGLNLILYKRSDPDVYSLYLSGAHLNVYRVGSMRLSWSEFVS